MSHPAYSPVSDFEKVLEAYTGAPHAITVDNCSNAIFLALTYENVKGKELTIPAHTYMSVPCAVIHAGAAVNFDHKLNNGNKLKGAYQIQGSRTWDSALTFTKNMWSRFPKGSFACLSFSGPRKHLKLGKAGAILTDDKHAMEWFKLARYSGRHPVGHETDNFAMVGWNYYLLPDIAARANILMMEMINQENEDLEFEYQDLSRYEMYKKGNRDD